MEGEKPRPLMPRMDRLDRLLNYLEEQQKNSSRRYQSDVTEGKSMQHLRPLASALEEVSSKGSLIERIQVLENRLLQLYMEMEEEERSNESRITISSEESKDVSSKEKRRYFGLKKRNQRVEGITGQRKRWWRWINFNFQPTC